MLNVQNLFFSYNGAPVFENIHAGVAKGCVLSVAGPNGSGKTSLLKCIALILKPSNGSAFIEGREAKLMPRRHLARQLGYVPQSIPSRFPMTVFEMVLAGRRPYISWRPSKEDLEQTASVIKEINLSDLAMRDYSSLSGGQAQKVLLARALAQETPYLLLDEPTSNLDLRHQLEVLEVITGLVKEKGTGVIMAMHDLNLASRFSDTIMMLDRGRVFCSGRPEDVMTTGNIREVYGVESDVYKEKGHLYIHPLRCSDTELKVESGKEQR